MNASKINQALSIELLEKYPFFSLIQPVGGIISEVGTFHVTDFAGPNFRKVFASLGGLTAAFPNRLSPQGQSVERLQVSGVGADECEEMALVRAVAEAAERYASCVFLDEDTTIATANELGAEALSFSQYSRCSEREYEHPRCFLRRFNPDEPIRWVKGFSLIDRKERFVPLVMTHLYIREWESEHFWHSISTGVAAHTNPLQAIVSAIGEVIERDAIALTWLLKLPLPKILLNESPPPALELKFNRLKRSRIEHAFFDATTDIGMPTVYGIQFTEGHQKLSQFVSCSAGVSAWDNCAKLIRESACGRFAVEATNTIPENFEDFYALEHGASFMGRPEQRSQFDFLANSPNIRPISTLKSEYPQELKGQYEFLIKRFRDFGMDVVLVDLTTDELRAAGLWVIRAVIPALVPMSCIYRSRYLGHPRIYEYARNINADIQREEDINLFPQPFA